MAVTNCMHTTPTRALERLTNIKPLHLHLREKAACIVARIYNSVDKSNWDGIGTQNKRGHLFLWNKFLGTGAQPIPMINHYNFSPIAVEINNTVHDDSEGISIYTDGSKTGVGVGSDG